MNYLSGNARSSMRYVDKAFTGVTMTGLRRYMYMYVTGRTDMHTLYMHDI